MVSEKLCPPFCIRVYRRILQPCPKLQPGVKDRQLINFDPRRFGQACQPKYLLSVITFLVSRPLLCRWIELSQKKYIDNIFIAHIYPLLKLEKSM